MEIALVMANKKGNANIFLTTMFFFEGVTESRKSNNIRIRGRFLLMIIF